MSRRCLVCHQLAARRGDGTHGDTSAGPECVIVAWIRAMCIMDIHCRDTDETIVGMPEQ